MNLLQSDELIRGSSVVDTPPTRLRDISGEIKPAVTVTAVAVTAVTAAATMVGTSGSREVPGRKPSVGAIPQAVTAAVTAVTAAAAVVGTGGSKEVPSGRKPSAGPPPRSARQGASHLQPHAPRKRVRSSSSAASSSVGDSGPLPSKRRDVTSMPNQRVGDAAQPRSRALIALLRRTSAGGRPPRARSSKVGQGGCCWGAGLQRSTSSATGLAALRSLPGG